MVILLTRFSSKICSYFEKEFNLNNLQVVKLNYSVTLLLSEISKFLILLIFFMYFKQTKLFMYSIFTLTLVRSYTGGLHFDTYLSCLGFSFLFFIFSITSSLLISLSIRTTIILVFIIFICLIFISPIPSKSRPNYSNKKLLRFKLINISIFIIHIFLYFNDKSNLYLTNALWVYFYQSIQLIIAKGKCYYEKHKMAIQETA